MSKVVRIVAMLMFAVFCCCFVPTTGALAADVSHDIIQPQYNYTQLTSVSLSISSSGVASCKGKIRAYATSSMINMTITLYKKSGESWQQVKTWSVENQSEMAYISETWNVSSGTYKVLMNGKVITSSGAVESLSGSSAEKTYD